MKTKIIAFLITLLYIPAAIIGNVLEKILMYIYQATAFFDMGFMSKIFSYAEPILMGIFTGWITALILTTILRKAIKTEVIVGLFVPLMILPTIIFIAMVVAPFLVPAPDIGGMIANMVTFITYAYLIYIDTKSEKK
jgi:hypothetical protein